MIALLPTNPLRRAFERYANPVALSFPDGSSLSSVAWISPVQKKSDPAADELAQPYDSALSSSFFFLGPPDCRVDQFPKGVAVTDSCTGKSFLVVRSHAVCLRAVPVYVWALLVPDLSQSL